MSLRSYVMRMGAAVLAVVGSGQAFAVCTFGSSSEPTLQQVFDSVLPSGTLSATDDCLAADNDKHWTAQGEAVATIIIELAGFSGTNVFGIYDINDPDEQVVVFDGGDGVGSTSSIELWADGPDYSVWVDDSYAGHFTTMTFGFFLFTQQGHFFTSDPAHNTADGQDHMYAYQGNGSTFTSGPMAGETFVETMYLLAFEDLLIPDGDEDFQDFVAAANFVAPIPLPGAFLLLGSAVIALFARRRREA